MVVGETGIWDKPTPWSLPLVVVNDRADFTLETRWRMQKLSIDVVPGTRPRHFRWKQVIETLAGERVVEHEGVLPPAVDDAVLALICLAKYQMKEIENLKKQVIELSSKKVDPPQLQPAPPSHNPKRRGGTG